MTELQTNFPKTSFMCAIRMTQTEVASLKSHSYLEAIAKWRQRIQIPQALSDALHCHLAIPPPRAPISREVAILNGSRNLFAFLLERVGGRPLEISCLFEGVPLPSVHLGAENERVKMEFSLEIAQEIGQQVTTGLSGRLQSALRNPRWELSKPKT